MTFDSDCHNHCISQLQEDLISTNGGGIANESRSLILYQGIYPNGQTDQLMENSQEK